MSVVSFTNEKISIPPPPVSFLSSSSSLQVGAVGRAGAACTPRVDLDGRAPSAGFSAKEGGAVGSRTAHSGGAAAEAAAEHGRVEARARPVHGVWATTSYGPLTTSVTIGDRVVSAFLLDYQATPPALNNGNYTTSH